MNIDGMNKTQKMIFDEVVEAQAIAAKAIGERDQLAEILSAILHDQYSDMRKSLAEKAEAALAKLK